MSRRGIAVLEITGLLCLSMQFACAVAVWGKTGDTSILDSATLQAVGRVLLAAFPISDYQPVP